MAQPRNTSMMAMDILTYQSNIFLMTPYRFVKWWNMSVPELMEKNELPPPAKDPAAAATAAKK